MISYPRDTPTRARSFGRVLRGSGLWLLSVLLVATAGATASLAPLSGAAASASPAPAPAPAQAPAAARACAELRLVVVDGNPKQVAGVLAPLVRSFKTRARQLDRRVTVDHLAGAFPAASTMVPRRLWGRPLQRTVTKHRVRTWARDVSPTATAAIRRLREVATACPEQHLVLAGFGQGAASVHRALVRLSADPVVRPRIVGAALIADPDRTPGTAAKIYGQPTAPRAGRGVATWRLTTQPDVPDGGQPVRVVQVCTRADAVCDPRTGTFRAALTRYRAYAGTEGASLVRDAGKRMAAQAARWPIPADADQVVTVDPGQEFDIALQARVSDSVRRRLLWHDIVAVPAGVTLSPDGRLAGTLSKAGAYRITYRVRNTAPQTSSTTGAVTVVVRPESEGKSSGGRSSCETRSDGTAWCWGENRYGQLGNGTDSDRTSPTRVNGKHEWKQVSAGGSATCGVTQAGALWCWGLNNRGQLGLGGGPQRWNPQRVGKGTRWASVSVGWMHACATRTDGTLWCWGGNDQGQLGIGAGADRKAPVAVATGRRWRSLAVGGWHTCATDRTDVAWCWGRNDLAQLGTGDLARRTRPTRVSTTARFSELDASWSGSCALSTSGSALCWGTNDQGQVGDGTRAQRRVPAAVSGGHRFSDLAMGDSHACGVDLEGIAWCWGSNRYGQVGDATRTTRQAPSRVAGDERWTTISGGWMHTCALTVDGQSQCWGNNESGQLGYGDRTDRIAIPGVRPRPVPARRYEKNVTVTSFNILGTNHTEPGAPGGGRTYAPGRLRSEWAVNLLQSHGTGIAGFQELTLDQRRVVGRSLRKTWSFYPPISSGQRPVWQTVGWDKSQWRMVKARLVHVPFRRKTRPNPVVELENKWTGRRIFVFNIHNSAKKTPERQRERDRAVAIEIKEVNKDRARGVQGLLMGDFNERERTFCKVVGKTDLEAVNGGSVRNGRCTPPKRLHIDWMFRSPAFGVVNHRYEKSGRVRRVTDHSVLTARLSLPGS